MGADHLRLAVAGDRPRVDDLRAGGRVDPRDAVLQPQVDRRHVLAGPGLHDVEDRLLAGGHHHAGRLAAHRQLDHLPLERPVEVPLAVGLVLEVPRQLARVGVQRQRGVEVQRVVVDAFEADRIAQRAGVVRVARTEERQVVLRVVAAGNPDRAAVAVLVGQAVPGVAPGRVGRRDGVEPPALLAGLRVEADDEVAAARAAGGAHHHRAARHQRAAGQAHALAGADYLRLPFHRAGPDVERHHVQVRGRQVQPLAVDGHAALEARRDVARQAAGVLPEQVSAGGVERVHLVAEAVHEQHAVVHDWGRLARPGRQRPRPRGAQAADVGGRDLPQRAVARRVVGAPPQQPVAVVRILQHGVGHRTDAVEGVAPHGNRRQDDAGRQPAAAGSPARRQRRHGRWVCRQRLRAGLDAVLLQQEGDQVGVGLVAERVRAVLRHRRRRLGEQRLHGARVPLRAEGGAAQRRRERAVVQVLAVAACAVLPVGGQSGIGLLGGVLRRRALRLLRRGRPRGQDRAAEERCRCRGYRSGGRGRTPRSHERPAFRKPAPGAGSPARQPDYMASRVASLDGGCAATPSPRTLARKAGYDGQHRGGSR